MSVLEAFGQLPPSLRAGLDMAYEEGGGMVNALIERGEMPPLRALMAGLAMDKVGRPLFEDALDSYARAYEVLPAEWPEVIVGGGAHAAIWAATKNRGGFPNGAKPLVLERFERFGGAFAVTQRPSFFLNSRNRPGPLGAVGTRDALNVIPGALMQPSDMSGSEYQSSADLGLVVRCTLALNAVIRKAEVQEIARQGDRLVVITDRGTVRANRVVLATGLGRSLKFTGSLFDKERVLSFGMFMKRFDTSMFPLRGLGRVAVVGGGDSGRTVVEALAGYGPYLGGSVASLDYVPRIDWYGVGVDMTKERWIECNRTRYKPLAALFPNQAGTVQNARVTGLNTARGLFRTPYGVQIDGRSYDTAILCMGSRRTLNGRRMAIDESLVLSGYRAGSVDDEPEKGALLGLVSDDKEFVVIGPAADLPFETVADAEPRIEANKVALFRLAPRTVTLATMLPPP